MDAVYRYCDEQIKIASPGTVESGELRRTPDGRAGVVQGLNPETTGGTVSLAVEGVFDATCAAATEFDENQAVYWDASANLAVTALGDSDDFYVGVATAASSNTQAFVRVALNVKPSTAALAGTVWTVPVVVDHADATAVDILPAALNPTGFVVLQVIARVDEVCAGASEDQLIVGIKGAGGSAVSTITAANASADAVGDVLHGTLTGRVGASGGVLAVIDPGVAVQAFVSQATSGSGLAGKFKVWVELLPL